MIRTGAQYRESIRDRRRVYINGERVNDVASHPMFKSLVDIRARIYDMQHDPTTRHVMTREWDAEVNAVSNMLPFTQLDWCDKRWATDTLAFARDLLNSDYAGHRLTFQLFAQSPPLCSPRGRVSQLRPGRPARLRQKGRRSF